jgi:Zn-dependent protease with chaperone function
LANRPHRVGKRTEEKEIQKMNGGWRRRSDTKLLASMALALLFLAPGMAWGVEPVEFKPGFNLFSPQQDVQLGRESAQEVDNAYPLVTDPQVLRYINDLGRRLASLAPNNNSDYAWTFKVINSSDINAFALPGGYVYVNCGTIAAAENEAQLAGVMAHESGHVVMRHGTHEASQALLARAPLLIVGSMLGQSGSLTDLLTQMGLSLGVNSILLRNSRNAESQADEVGTYILYQAGYDPHAMAQFFEIVEKKYPRKTIQFLSDHPNPENRVKNIDSEIALLGPGKEWKTDSPEFEDTKKRLLNLPAPPKANPAPTVSATSPSPPPPPSSRLIKFEGYGFSIAYPDNWHVQRNEDAVALIPPGGIVEAPESGAAQAYGASISRFQPQNDQQGNWGLVDATQELLDTLRESNPNVRVIEQRPMNLKGRSALSTLLETDSPLQGQKERDLLVTTRRSNSVFSLIFIAPQSSFDAYKPTFDAMLQSLELQ